MAADVEQRSGFWPFACPHGRGYSCTECFDAELRAVVALRFAADEAALDSIDGERETYRRRREAEAAAYSEWAAERSRRKKIAAEERQWRSDQDALEKRRRQAEDSRLYQERAAVERAKHERAMAALVERILEQAARPRITAANAEQYPPPYPRERLCEGAECACKRYRFNPLIAYYYPRCYKRKNPYLCRGSSKDRWCCESPCSGSELHLPTPCLLSETSELVVWYAQVMGESWLGARYPCKVTAYAIDIVFEKAFRQWRKLLDRGDGLTMRREEQRRARRN